MGTEPLDPRTDLDPARTRATLALRRLTVRGLARRLAMPHTTLWRYLNARRRPPVNVARAIEAALDVTAGFLTGGKS